MILLDQIPCLQNALVVGGAEVPIETGFRAWLRFGRVLREYGVCDPSVLLCDPPVDADWRPEAVAFLADEQATPAAPARPSGDRAYDLELDAEYLVGSFQSAYGIDLTDEGLSMHWHRFMALLRSLPASTKLSEIAGYRTWTKAEYRRSHESLMQERKRAWRLPDDKSGSAYQRKVDQQMAWFGDVTP